MLTYGPSFCARQIVYYQQHNDSVSFMAFQDETLLMVPRLDCLDWDSKTYHDVTGAQDGSNQAKEQDFKDQFRPLDAGGTIHDSCTVVDKHDRVEVIYLSGVLTPERQVGKFKYDPFSGVVTF